MEKLKAKASVELTLEQVNHINNLIERDKAKPIIEARLETLDEKFYKCPTCGRPTGYVKDNDNPFCKKCGQRLDYENIAL